jgi:hypothetical protein
MATALGLAPPLEEIAVHWFAVAGASVAAAGVWVLLWSFAVADSPVCRAVPVVEEVFVTTLIEAVPHAVLVGVFETPESEASRTDLAVAVAAAASTGAVPSPG